MHVYDRYIDRDNVFFVHATINLRDLGLWGFWSWVFRNFGLWVPVIYLNIGVLPNQANYPEGHLVEVRAPQL